MKAILKVLIVWITLLAVPLQGFASATMCHCAPSAAAHHDHDEAMADGASPAGALDAHAAAATDHHAAAHHCAKCAGCGACGSCMSMLPACLALQALVAPSSLSVPSDHQVLASVDLALPERPPRA